MTRRRHIFSILRWLKSAYPNSPHDTFIMREEDVERVNVVFKSMTFRTAESISIVCASDIEITISFKLSSRDKSRGKALLAIMEGEELLYAKKATEIDHEDLPFMLRFLNLYSIMWWYEEKYFKELAFLKRQAMLLKWGGGWSKSRSESSFDPCHPQTWPWAPSSRWTQLFWRGTCVWWRASSR